MRSSILSGLVLVVAPCFVAEQAAMANPLGGVVAAGTATISQSGNTLIINQSSSHAIIDWSSFNMAAGESASFHFLGSAGANSAVLNEVSGNAGQSFLNGLLNSYVGAGNHVGGTVFIYNPNGLLIGPQGFINVGSFVGTTLSPSDSSFMKGGALSLGGPSVTGGSSIQNEGQISALDGDIFLIAHNVVNSGALTANNVGLAAGSYVEIKQPGEPGSEHISILAGDPSNPGGTGVNNTTTGVIKAVTTQLQASGGNVYALAVNNSGVIHADTLVSQGGKIYLTGNGGLVQNSGALDASDTAAGGKGGAVEVTGSQVTLTGTSTINANGDAGGGTVLIGGGSHGKDPSVPDATSTTVAAGSTITANAIAKGNGGDVVVWGNSDSFAGFIAAGGGLKGGNGGSVEVSGHQLGFNGLVDTQAPKGEIGNLLLDPTDLLINNTTDSGATVSGGVVTLSGNESVLTWNTIIANLNMTGLTLSTVGSPGNGPMNGTITIGDTPSAATTTLNTGASLTLQAAAAILVDAPITTFYGGNTLQSLTMQSGTLMTIGAPISAGLVSLQSAGTMSIDANVSASSTSTLSTALSVWAGTSGPGTATGDLIFGSGVTMQANSQSYRAGNGTASGTAADLTGDLNPTVNFPATFVSYSGGPITSFTYRQDASISDANIPVVGGLNDQFHGMGAPVNYTIQSDAGNVTLATGANVAGSALTLNAPLGTVFVDDNLSLASLSASATAIDLNGTAASETITTTGGDQNYTGPMTLGANTTLNSGTVELPAVSGGTYALTLNNSGLVTASGTVTAGTLILEGAGNLGTLASAIGTDVGNIEFENSSGSVWLNNGATPVNISGTTLTANGNVSLTAGATTFGTTTVGGNLAVTASGAIGQTAAVSVTGTTMLDAGANAITLNNSGDEFVGAVTVNNSGANNVALANSGTALIVNGTVGGNLIASGPGISDGGAALTVGGTTSLTAGAANTINFSDAGDTFTGAVTISSAARVTLVDAAALEVNGTVTGNLIATGAGIGDGGSALTVGGTTSLTAGTGHAINFGTAGDTFTGAVTVQSGDNVTLADTAALTVNGTVTGNLVATGAGIGDGGSALTVGGTTSLTAGTGNAINFGTVGDTFTGAVTVQSGDNVTLMDTAALTINGTVTGSLTAIGAGIGDGGSVLTVGGTTSLTAGMGHAISFGMTGDTFSGAVTINSGDNVTLMDTAALAVNGTVTGNLIATGAGISDGGSVLTVDGATSLTAGTANAINLTDPGDTLTGAVTVHSGANVSLVDTVALAVNGTVTGSLTAMAPGISDGGSTLTVGGTASLTAGAGNGINFSQAGDTFTGAVTIHSGDNVTLVDTAALALNGMVTGNLSATGASIGDGGSALTVGGTTSLTAGAVNAINFSDAGDTFTGAVTVHSGDNVTLVDTAALVVSGTVSGNLIASGAGISDGGNLLTVAGTTSLTAGTGNPIVLEAPGDSFAGAVTVNSGKNVTLDDTLPLLLSGTVSGNLNVSANGIDIDGALTVNGLQGATLNADPNNTGLYDLTVAAALTTAGSSGPVKITAANINLTAGSISSGSGLVSITASDNGTIALGAGTGDLTLTGPELANITTSGGLTLSTTGGASVSVNGVTAVSSQNVTGPLTMNAPGGTVSFVTAPSSFSSLVVNAGGIDLNTSVTTATAAGQAYNGMVTLTAPVTLTATGGGGVSFSSKVDGGYALDVEAAGVAAFGGVVGGNAPLMTLTVDGTLAGTSIALNGGAVSTSGSQSYGAFGTGTPLTLGASTTLNGAAITLGLGAVTGGGENLTLNNSGLATLNGVVGTVEVLTASGTGNLTVNNNISAGSLSDSETTTTLNGTGGLEGITTTGAQTFTGATVNLGANTTLTAGALALCAVAGNTYNLTLDNSGMATLNGNVTGVNILTANNLGGTLAINDSLITTTGTQNYGEPVLLQSGVTLSSTGVGAAANITFSSTVNGAESLDVETAGTTTFGGAVGGGPALASLTVDGSVAGTAIMLNGGSVSTTGAQEYSTLGTATPLFLGASTTLNGTSLSLEAVSGGGHNLTLNNSGQATLNGNVAGVNNLTANFLKGGTLVINASTITTSADQDYLEPVTLGASSVTLNSGTIELASVTLPAIGDTLTLNNAALATLSGAVTGSGTLMAGGVGTLALDGAIHIGSVIDNEATTLAGGSVTTTGGQSYSFPVTLTSATTLSSTGNGNIVLGSTVDGAQTLDVETAGLTTFGGVVGGNAKLTSLTVDGTDSGMIDLNGGAVTTTGSQTYGASAGTTLVLGGPTTILTGSALSLETVSGNSLTLVNSGLATLNGPVSLTGGLAASGSGSLLVQNAISAGTISDMEPATFNTTALLGNNSTVTTTGDQDYAGTVTFEQNTTLNAGTTMEFEAVNLGSETLTLNNSGLATLYGPISGTGTSELNAIGSGTLMIENTINVGTFNDDEMMTGLLGGTITTVGGQVYGAVTLDAATILNATTIVLGAVTGDNNDLTLNNTALAQLTGNVTGVNHLTANNVGGSLDINAANITTMTDQDYKEPVFLTDTSVTLHSQTIELAAVTGNGNNLTLNNTGVATLNGAESDLGTLTAGGSGTLVVDSTISGAVVSDSQATTLGGGSVTTSGAQSYAAPVTLAAPTALVSTGGGNITLASTVDGAQTLNVETTGTTTLGGAVGDNTKLTSLTVDASDPSGLISLNGGAVTTTGGQTYDGAVTLGLNTSLNDTGIGSIVFGPTATITGAADSLTVATTGATAATFGAAVITKSLTVDASDTAGLIALNGGAVTTTAGQTYDGAVTLGANTLLQDTLGGQIVFGPSATITGPVWTLDVETTGAMAATFGAAVATRSLTVDASDTAGLINMNAGTVTTTAGQTYNAQVTLGMNTVLTDSGTGKITFGPSATINGTTYALDVETTGATTATFGAPVTTKSLTVDANDPSGLGLIDLNGGAVTTTAGQTYDGAVTLGGDTMLKDLGAAKITFGPTATVTGPAETLDVETTGTASFGGAVNVQSFSVDQTDTGGLISLNGGKVTTTAGQTYGGAVTLGANTVLADTSAGLITFGPAAKITGAAETLEVETAGAATFDGAVNVRSLTVDQMDTGGTIALNGGSVTTSAGQNYDGAVILGVGTLLSDAGSSPITFGPSAAISGAQSLEVETGGATTFGAPVNVKSLVADQTDTPGTIDLNGGTVTTSAGQIYDGAVKLSTGTLLSDTGGSAISFGPSATISGAQSLEVETGGTTTFGSSVNVKNLTADQTDTGGTIDLNGGTVTTSAGQIYGGAVTLGAGTVLSDTGSSTITFGPSATISGAQSLEVETGGAMTFGAAVNVQSLIADQTDAGGSIGLNGGSVMTAFGQTYGGTVTLGANTTLTGTTLSLQAVNIGGDNLTLVNSGPAALNRAVNGTGVLTASGAGTLAVDGIITAGSVNDSEGTTLSGGTVTTTGGDQNYTGTVTLGLATILNSGTIELAGVAGSGYDLTLNNSSLARLNGNVAGVGSLTANNPTGSVAINAASIMTTVDQDYAEPVSLGAAAVTLNSATIELAAVTGNGHNLTLNNTALATLNGTVSSLGAFSASGIGTLTVDNTISGAVVSDGEATMLNGGSVITSGGQTYGAPVTLGAATTLSSTGGGNITLGSTVNGAQTLDVETGGTATLGGAVGANTKLTSLTVDASDTSGSINLNGGAVTTTAGQTYDGAVTLGQNTVLKDTGTGSITFGPTATVTGAAETLDVETTGATAATFGASVNVQSLTVDASDTSGLIGLNGGTVTTTAGQTYDGAVTLGANTVLKDTGIGSITFGRSATVAGSAETLDVETTGTTAATFGAAVVTKSLTVDAGDSSGLIGLNGGAVTTSAGQTYDGPLTLGQNTVLKDIGNGAIAFGASATVTGTAETLDVETTGASSATFGAAVTTKSLMVDLGDSSGLIGLNGGAVTTSGGQTYDGAVTLGQNTALKDAGAGSITFGASATITGTAWTLDVETSGATSATFGAAVVTKSLMVDAGDFSGLIGLNGGTVTTTAGQTYDGAVTLGQSTVLKDTGAGSITFGTSATVTGATETLDVETTGATTATFGGAVSVKSLTVDAGDSSGLIGLNGGAVTTSAGQTYDGAVTLGADTLLKDTSAAAITFGPSARIVGAADTLEAETAGTTTFGGAVAVKSLIVDQGDTGGTIDLNGGSITTSAGQVYDGAVTVSGSALLIDTGNSAITFGPLAIVSGAQSLEVETGGKLTFDASVNVKSLMADQMDTTGTIDLNGGAVTTTAGQTYGGAVTLGQNTVLKDTGAGGISFGPGASISGTGETLDVETTGATAASFGGPVSVQSLTVEAGDTAASIHLNGGTVTTTAGQTYDGAVTLGQNTLLKDTGATGISFGPGASISGTGETLDVETTGATAATFGGPVNVQSLTVDASDTAGLIHLNGGAVTTTAGQTYDGAVTLGQNTVLKDTGAGAISFGPSATISGAAQTLDVETTGAATATFDAAVVVKSLTVDAGDSSGLIALNGATVTTTAGQTYDGAVTLGQNTMLKDMGAGAIAFGPSTTISGPAETLDVETTGATAATFGAAVNVRSLTVDAGNTSGLIGLNGGAVTTTAGQTYGGAVTLGQAAVLEDTGSGAVTFNSTVDGAQSLTVATAGPATFHGAVGGITPLSSLTVEYFVNKNNETGSLDLNGDSVTTTGNQIYFGPLDLSANSVLSALNPSSTVALMTVTGNGYNFMLSAGQLEGIGPNGSGTIFFNNTGTGTVNLVGATENANLSSVTFFNPAQALQPGLAEIPVLDLIDELLDDEGGGIRSAFDLANKTVVYRRTVQAKESPEYATSPGAHLLRSSQVFKQLGLSPYERSH